MQIAKNVKSARAAVRKAKEAKKVIGFVPTMGALHDGHMALVRAAKKDCDFVVVSIFVNPAQFSRGEDLSKYPRTFKKDLRLLSKENVDMVFCPSTKEIYPGEFSTYVEENDLSKVLCAKTRPIHFKGVCTVVAKLFNIIQPQMSYFGQKDYQQALVVKKMVKDLNFPLTVKIVSTVREKDGLAMSSRNVYLSASQRQDAALLFKSLNLAKEIIRLGEKDAKKVVAKMRKLILFGKNTKIDYIEIVDAKTLCCLDKINGKIVIALAVYIGKTRLIDNMVLQVR